MFVLSLSLSRARSLTLASLLSFIRCRENHCFDRRKHHCSSQQFRTVGADENPPNPPTSSSLR